MHERLKETRKVQLKALSGEGPLHGFFSRREFGGGFGSSMSAAWERANTLCMGYTIETRGLFEDPGDTKTLDGGKIGCGCCLSASHGHLNKPTRGTASESVRT